MAVWFMRRLQCLLCEESSLFHVEIATDARAAKTPANDRRDKALRTRQRAHAPNDGVAIV
jgi:hypothetical protein